MGGTSESGRSSFFRRAASVIGWLWGGLSIFLGLLMLAIGPSGFIRIFGLSAISAGLILLPPVARWIGRRVRFFQRPGVPLVSSIVVGITVLVINPYPPPEPRERVRDVTETSASSTEAPRQPVADQPRSSRSQEEAEIQAMWAELTSLTQPCDAAASAAADALDLSRSDLVAAYSAAESAKRICASAGLDVMGIDPPRSLARDDRRAFEEAINECGNAYAGKSVMFDRMLRVIDGDRRPSRVAAVQEAAQASQAQALHCVLRITTLADARGVSLETEPTG